MKDFTSFFLLLVVITILYLYLESKSSEVIKVKADDGKDYLVRNLPDRVDAANKLALIKKRLSTIVDELYNKKNTDEHKSKLEEIELLKSNYRPDSLSESSPGNKYTSYSIDKGKKIVYCLRTKDGTNKLIDDNTITFVAIHELAHLMTKEIGHVPTFWDNMKYLLDVGIKLGVYDYVDYGDTPVKYCGTKITDTPLDK
jgi:predicted metal-dependent hydrolase